MRPFFGVGYALAFDMPLYTNKEELHVDGYMLLLTKCANVYLGSPSLSSPLIFYKRCYCL